MGRGHTRRIGVSHAAFQIFDTPFCRAPPGVCNLRCKEVPALGAIDFFGFSPISRFLIVTVGN
jgi:hypothetical protein